MSSFEPIPLYSIDTQPELDGIDMGWRTALHDTPDKLAAFEALDPEGQSLITRRMELQQDLRAAQEQIVHHKIVFDAIVNKRLQGIPVDSEKLEEARHAQSQAYKYCVEATASVLDVEGRLCWRGLASAPYLELTLRMDGQALNDHYQPDIEPYDPNGTAGAHGIAS